MSDADPDEIHEQLVDAFEGADYPVENPMELLPALPNGPATTFESGDFSMSIMQIQSASEGDPTERFPYDSPEAIADDIVEGLQEAGELPG
ncbi:MTH865 family protein [Halopiger goleimassiliensis]|uniref:MTH865 family protein n=1 Tax=Halopiger goleimassiliensis TaxID=1293048 RepID=UPI000677DF29|nr:MTH865 family protein [Halopiger goleimassiliensis]